MSKFLACCLVAALHQPSILLGQSNSIPRGIASTETFADASSEPAKLELVAIQRVRDGVNVAWRPSGTQLPVDEAWPATVQLSESASTYGFILRLRESDKPYSLVWETPGLVWDDPGEALVEYASVSGAFDSSGTVDLRAGVVSEWGPWQLATKEGEVQGDVCH